MIQSELAGAVWLRHLAALNPLKPKRDVQRLRLREPFGSKKEVPLRTPARPLVVVCERSHETCSHGVMSSDPQILQARPLSAKASRGGLCKAMRQQALLCGSGNDSVRGRG